MKPYLRDIAIIAGVSLLWAIAWISSIFRDSRPKWDQDD